MTTTRDYRARRAVKRLGLIIRKSRRFKNSADNFEPAAIPNGKWCKLGDLKKLLKQRKETSHESN
jgi:hypothetical protein